MVLKKLEELSASELMTELKRVGIKGKFVKAQAIVRLSTHLVDVSEDPLTSEFDPDVPVEEASEDNPEDYVVMNDGNDNAGVTRSEAASISGLVGAINASTTTPLSLPLSTTPCVSTSSASISTATITTSSAYAPPGSLGQFPPFPGVGNPGMGYPGNMAQYPGMSGMGFPSQYPAMSANPWMPAMPGMMPPTSWPIMYGPTGS